MRLLVAVMESKIDSDGRENFRAVNDNPTRAAELFRALTGVTVQPRQAVETPARDDYWCEVPDETVRAHVNDSGSWWVHLPGVGQVSAAVEMEVEG